MCAYSVFHCACRTSKSVLSSPINVSVSVLSPPTLHVLSVGSPVCPPVQPVIADLWPTPTHWAEVRHPPILWMAARMTVPTTHLVWALTLTRLPPLVSFTPTRTGLQPRTLLPRMWTSTQKLHAVCMHLLVFIFLHSGLVRSVWFHSFQKFSAQWIPVVYDRLSSKIASWANKTSSHFLRAWYSSSKSGDKPLISKTDVICHYWNNEISLDSDWPIKNFYF